jgi:hypothetical protein
MNLSTLETALRSHYQQKANQLRSGAAELPPPRTPSRPGRPKVLLALGVGVAAAAAMVAVAIASDDHQQHRISTTAPTTPASTTTTMVPSDPPPDVGPTLAEFVDENYVVPASELGLVGVVKVDGTTLTIEFASAFMGPAAGEPAAACEFDYLLTMSETEAEVRVAVDMSEPAAGLDACRFRWTPRQNVFDLTTTTPLGSRQLFVLGTPHRAIDVSTLSVPDLPEGWSLLTENPAYFRDTPYQLWLPNTVWTRFWGPPPAPWDPGYPAATRRSEQEGLICGSSLTFQPIKGLRLTEGPAEVFDNLELILCGNAWHFVGEVDINGVSAVLYSLGADNHYQVAWRTATKAYLLEAVDVDMGPMLAFARNLAEP